MKKTTNPKLKGAAAGFLALLILSALLLSVYQAAGYSFPVPLLAAVAGSAAVDADTIRYSYPERPTADFLGWSKVPNMQSTFGSYLFTRYDGSLFAGIPQLFIKENIQTPFLRVLRPDTGAMSAFAWHPHKITFGAKGYSNEFTLDGYYAFVGEETVLLKMNLKETKNLPKTVTFSGSVGTTVATLTPAAGPANLDIQTVHTQSSFGSNTFTFNWLLRSRGFDSVTASGKNYVYTVNLQPGESREVVFVLTTKRNELQVAGILANPDAALAGAKSRAEEWIARFKPGSYVANDPELKGAYYRNIMGFYYNIQHPIPNENRQNPSNFLESDLFISPSIKKYRGMWSTDAEQALTGLFLASDDPYMTTLAKGIIDTYVRTASSGVMWKVIRDTSKDNGNQMSLMYCVAVEAAKREGSTAWLAQVYPTFKTTLAKEESSRLDRNGLFFSQGLEFGDGRALSVPSDQNAYAYLRYRCMAEAARMLGNTADQAAYEQKTRFLDGKVAHFWNEDLGLFVDLTKDTYSQKLDVYPKGLGFGLGFLLMTKHPDITPAMVARIAQTARTPAWDLASPSPDIPSTDPKYLGSGYWWKGSSWTIIGVPLVWGLHKYGYDTEANYHRDKLLRQIAAYDFGLEYYNNAGSMDGATGPYNAWTFAHYVALANTADFFPWLFGEGTVTPPTCTPAAETCDAADNDCDGVVDEGCVCDPGETQVCTVDGNLGSQTCDAGQWAPCVADPKPPVSCDVQIPSDPACVAGKSADWLFDLITRVLQALVDLIALWRRV